MVRLLEWLSFKSIISSYSTEVKCRHSNRYELILRVLKYQWEVWSWKRLKRLNYKFYVSLLAKTFLRRRKLKVPKEVSDRITSEPNSLLKTSMLPKISISFLEIILLPEILKFTNFFIFSWMWWNSSISIMFSESCSCQGELDDEYETKQL